MHWSEELYYTTVGAVPFLGLPTWGLRIARHGTPSQMEIIRSTVATIAIGHGIDVLHHRITGSPNLGHLRLMKTMKTGAFLARAGSATAKRLPAAYLSYKALTDETVVESKTTEVNAINALLNKILGTDIGEI